MDYIEINSSGLNRSRHSVKSQLGLSAEKG